MENLLAFLTTMIEKMHLRGARLEQTNVDGMTPIMVAAVWGHINAVVFLTERGASLEQKDKNDHTIIHLAAQHKQDEVIKAILDLESTPGDFMVNENDMHDNTPLHLACEAGHLDSVEVLIQVLSMLYPHWSILQIYICCFLSRLVLGVKTRYLTTRTRMRRLPSTWRQSVDMLMW